MIAVAALLLATAQPLFDWLDSTPLSQSIAQINNQIPEVAEGDDGPITETLVLAAIDTGLTQGKVPEHLASVLEGIAQYKRLPPRASLASSVFYSGATPGNPPIKNVVVSLVISNDANGDFTLPIFAAKAGFMSQ
ncbi:hypothetical protein [Rubripirellula lacrimiformis]|uniref:hypothetical protein n=1 Tax=Rubripirellula lacrimiformis TaxID=1930273 RepID=UPI0011A7A1B7|nr:hypothetical protein [Rubripirellula lacrimiformis]